MKPSSKSFDSAWSVVKKSVVPLKSSVRHRTGKTPERTGDVGSCTSNKSKPDESAAINAIEPTTSKSRHSNVVLVALRPVGFVGSAIS
jgi:hypothetical protein